MALHPSFPESPYTILDPALRWFPAEEVLRESSAEKLMPPQMPSVTLLENHRQKRLFTTTIGGGP